MSEILKYEIRKDSRYSHPRRTLRLRNVWARIERGFLVSTSGQDGEEVKKPSFYEEIFYEQGTDRVFSYKLGRV